MHSDAEKRLFRFLSFVHVDEYGCWVWTGARSRGKGNKEWYGSFCIAKGVVVRAHAYSFDTFIGPLPKGWHRDHRCRDFGAPFDNSLCVHPHHIDAVTPTENNLRRWRKHADVNLVLGPYRFGILGWPGAGEPHATGANGTILCLAGDLDHG